MSGRRLWLHGFALVFLSFAGCWTTEPQLKPKRAPEEYVLPPSDDPRFTNYMTYPKETMNGDRVKVERDRNQIQVPGTPAPTRMPGSAGMGSGY